MAIPGIRNGPMLPARREMSSGWIGKTNAYRFLFPGNQLWKYGSIKMAVSVKCNQARGCKGSNEIRYFEI